MPTNEAFPRRVESALDDLLVTDRIASERGQRRRPANLVDNVLLPVVYWLLERRLDIGKVDSHEEREGGNVRKWQSTVSSEHEEKLGEVDATVGLQCPHSR